MAVFGLPGGAEWVVIAVTVLLLFVPGLGFGLLGYVLGRRSVNRALPAEPDDARSAEPEDDDE